MEINSAFLHKALKYYFGYDEFRTGQEEIVANILNGSPVLAVLPTGAGKSVCFQLPSLLLKGITLVISPLISLMKDQAENLSKRGIPAAYLDSSMTGNAYGKIFTMEYLVQANTENPATARTIVNIKNGKKGNPVIGEVTVIKPKNNAAKNREYGFDII